MHICYLRCKLFARKTSSLAVRERVSSKKNCSFWLISFLFCRNQFLPSRLNYWVFRTMSSPVQGKRRIDTDLIKLIESKHEVMEYSWGRLAAETKVHSFVYIFRPLNRSPFSAVSMSFVSNSTDRRTRLTRMACGRFASTCQSTIPSNRLASDSWTRCIIRTLTRSVGLSAWTWSTRVGLPCTTCRISLNHFCHNS